MFRVAFALVALSCISVASAEHHGNSSNHSHGNHSDGEQTWLGPLKTEEIQFPPLAGFIVSVVYISLVAIVPAFALWRDFRYMRTAEKQPLYGAVIRSAAPSRVTSASDGIVSVCVCVCVCVSML